MFWCLHMQLGYVISLLIYMSIVDFVARPIQPYCDNFATMLFCKNNKSIFGAKHLEVKYLIIKEQVKKGEVTVEHLGIEFMLADSLTKGLRPNIFKGHVTNAG